MFATGETEEYWRIAVGRPWRQLQLSGRIGHLHGDVAGSRLPLHLALSAKNLVGWQRAALWEEQAPQCLAQAVCAFITPQESHSVYFNFIWLVQYYPSVTFFQILEAPTAFTSSSRPKMCGSGPIGVMDKGLICVWLRV